MPWRQPAHAVRSCDTVYDRQWDEVAWPNDLPSQNSENISHGTIILLALFRCLAWARGQVAILGEPPSELRFWAAISGQKDRDHRMLAPHDRTRA